MDYTRTIPTELLAVQRLQIDTKKNHHWISCTFAGGPEIDALTLCAFVVIKNEHGPVILGREGAIEENIMRDIRGSCTTLWRHDNEDTHNRYIADARKRWRGGDIPSELRMARAYRAITRLLNSVPVSFVSFDTRTNTYHILVAVPQSRINEHWCCATNEYTRAQRAINGRGRDIDYDAPRLEGQTLCNLASSVNYLAATNGTHFYVGCNNATIRAAVVIADRNNKLPPDVLYLDNPHKKIIDAR